MLLPVTSADTIKCHAAEPSLTTTKTSPQHNPVLNRHDAVLNRRLIHDNPNDKFAGVIRADGHASVQVGDSYSIVHNYLADSHLAETDKRKERNEFLRRLHTTPYEDRKNRNPKRGDGTCEWFTAHGLFRNWQAEISALLWVSADPGCGKSVLARYLVDDVFPSSATRTTCYFFFKDDFDDQKVLEGALCCILRQLFVQKPALLLDEILDDFREEGDQLFASFNKSGKFSLGRPTTTTMAK